MVYHDCVGRSFGSSNKEVSTLDLLKRIELKMEELTQTLERLPEEKVKIAQRVRIYFALRIFERICLVAVFVLIQTLPPDFYSYEVVNLFG